MCEAVPATACSSFSAGSLNWIALVLIKILRNVRVVDDPLVLCVDSDTPSPWNINYINFNN